MMAKKQEKSIEQLLEEALVLYEKTPYNLPSNWCWTTWGSIANLYTGNSINEREKDLKYKGLLTGFNYIATKDIGFDYKIEYENGIKIPYNETRFKKARKNSILLCIEGGSAGRKLGFLEEEVCFVNKLCCFDLYEVVDKLYFYYLQSNEFFNVFTASKVGLIGGVSVNNLKLLPVPLAPLEEQKRIFEVIEKQFVRLDEAGDLIQKSLDFFADRKSVILHKAFTGELTKNWRVAEAKPFLMNRTPLYDVTEKIGDGLHGTPKYSDNGEYYFINGNNFSGKSIEIKSDTKTVDFDEYKKYFIELNDRTVLLSINGTLGKVALYYNEKIILGKSACYIIVKENCLNKYFLRYYFLSKEFLDFAHSKATGSTIKNLGLKQIRNHEIWIPSIEEQEEIVRILDSIFEKEDKSKELIDILDKIDEMKKSILTRAFRGELGTSNPADESAIELLRKILNKKSERDEVISKAPSKSIYFDYSLLKNNIEIEIVKEIIKKGGRVSPDYFYRSKRESNIFEIIETVDSLIENKILRREKGFLIINSNED